MEKMHKEKEYMTEKISPIVEEMVKSILIHKPQNIVDKNRLIINF